MENKKLTEAQKLEILEKLDNGTLTNKDLEEIGGIGELLNLWAPIPEEPPGNRHVYSPGKFSFWTD